MSQENLEVLDRVIAAINRRDRAAFLAETHPDAVTIPAPNWPEQGPYVGDAAWHLYLNLVDASLAETESQIGETVDLGDQVVVYVARSGLGRTSGIRVDLAFWALVTFSDGKIVRTQWFQEREEALEAVGRE